MTHLTRAAHTNWWSVMQRNTFSFTPAYKPAPLTFWGQLWAALTRSTPAFTGARAYIEVAQPQKRRTSTYDLAMTTIVTPTFLNRERADRFGEDRGKVLALTLARDRELGLTLAREFAHNCADFLAGIFGSNNPDGLSNISGYHANELSEFYRLVEKAYTIALALDRVLARDLNRNHAYARSCERHRIRSSMRSYMRSFIRPHITDGGVRGDPAFLAAVENLLKLADIFYRPKPVTITSSRSRDISLDLIAATDMLRIPYTVPVQISTGLQQNLARIDLRGADLPGAQFACANLSNANLSTAHLSRANLSGANLNGSHLIGADLSETDLSGAQLVGTDLSDANLRGADLSFANMSEAEPRGIVWSKFTIWPAAREREMWARSTEIEPGVFRVDAGGERSPLSELIPTR
jgi:hypothetical protein